MIDIDDIIALVLLVGTYYLRDESLVCHVFSIRFTVDEFGVSSISSTSLLRFLFQFHCCLC